MQLDLFERETPKPPDPLAHLRPELRGLYEVMEREWRGEWLRIATFNAYAWTQGAGDPDRVLAELVTEGLVERDGERLRFVSK